MASKLSHSSSQNSEPSSSLRSFLLNAGYSLGHTIGSGAYAKVKSGTILKTQKKVAIKIIDLKSSPQSLGKKFLPRELSVLSEVKHPNIINVMDILRDEANNSVLVIMELATNGDILDYINQHGRMPDMTACGYFTQFIQGMQYLHGRDITHRDLKCENLLIDQKGNLIIADMGFVTREPGILTTYCGSIAYVAPEVLKKKPYLGKPADVWSMGIILFAMLYAKLPFKENDLVQKGSELMSRVDYFMCSPPSQDALAFIRCLLVYDANNRISVDNMLDHKWFVNKKQSQTEVMTGN